VKLPPGARGYGRAHRRMRLLVAPFVRSGRAVCGRCGLPISPGSDWDLGHTEDRSAYSGPEHAACNRAAGARKTNRARKLRVDPPPPPGW